MSSLDQHGTGPGSDSDDGRDPTGRLSVQHSRTIAPTPDEAVPTALRHVDLLAEAGALDHGSRHVLDQLVGSWAEIWRGWVRNEQQNPRAAMEQEQAEAVKDEEYLRGRLGHAEHQLRSAQDELLRVGVRHPSLPAPAGPPAGETGAGETGAGETGATAEHAHGPVTAEHEMAVRSAAALPDGLPVVDADLPRDGTRGQRLLRALGRQAGVWLPILVLSSADAYGFYNTLTTRIQTDSNQLVLFTVGLTVAAVTAALAVGRQTRRYRLGFDASLAVIGLLLTAWLGLGLVMFWLRAHTSAPKVTGTTEFATTTVAGHGSDIAPLLLALYVITGLLAMIHGYRGGDPRLPQLRTAHRVLRGAQERHSDAQFHHAGAIGRRERADRELLRLREDLDDRQAQCTVWRDDVLHEVRLRIAWHVGDPPSTTGLVEG